MTVFIFYTDYNDIDKLMTELTSRGVIPKCREPAEREEPSWRETSNYVHIRTAGSWKNLSAAAGKQITTTKEAVQAEGLQAAKSKGAAHSHKYSAGDQLLLEEEAVQPSEIINYTDLDLGHMSFGNGLTLIKPFGFGGGKSLAILVVDPSLKGLAKTAIEELKL